MSEKEEISRNLHMAGFYHRIFLGSVFIYAVVLVYMRYYSNLTPVVSGLERMEVIFSVLGVISLSYGYLAPRKIAKFAKMLPQGEKRWQLLFTISITQGGAFEAVAVYGFVLGILGAGWAIVLLFFAIAFIAMLHTFPTEKRWNRLVLYLEEKKDNT